METHVRGDITVEVYSDGSVLLMNERIADQIVSLTSDETKWLHFILSLILAKDVTDD